MPPDNPFSVQLFGYRDSRPTQAAIRFFRERRVAVTFVDLAQRPIARAELQRFSQKFGAAALLDEESRPYRDAGLGYMRLDQSQIFERLLENPRLIRLPLARAGSQLSVGPAESDWLDWVQSTNN